MRRKVIVTSEAKESQLAALCVARKNIVGCKNQSLPSYITRDRNLLNPGPTKIPDASEDCL